MKYYQLFSQKLLLNIDDLFIHFCKLNGIQSKIVYNTESKINKKSYENKSQRMEEI